MTASTTPAATAHAIARPWLARVHPGLFGISLGILGLGGAWRRLAPLVGEVADAVFVVCFGWGAGVLAILTVLWCAKVVRHFDVVRQQWVHPVQGAMIALLPVSILLAVAQIAPYERDGHALATVVTLAALVLQGAIAWQVVAQLSTGRMAAELVTPALYVPIVPGGFVGAMALDAIGLPGWAMLLLGMGLGGWVLLEVRILHRLFSGALPAALRPTLGFEMAPAAVGALAVATLWPRLPAELLMIGLGIASGPVFAVLTRWRWWSAVPFSFGFWSFSFPIAALAGAAIEAVRRAGWPAGMAFGAVAIASILIGFLALRTLWLLVRGRLLPPQ